MASWTTLVRPDYSTRFDRSQETTGQRPTAQQLPSSLPTIKLAIPRTSPLQTPKLGLPVNPSPHPSVDPAIQAPLGGRVSPTDFYRSPLVEQREYLSPREISPQRFVDFKQPKDQSMEAYSYSLSRSSSQTSLGGCQHCHCCQRQKGHARSNSYSSIASSRTSSSVNLSSTSPNMSSPAATPPMEQKRSSAFGRTFKFLQRSSSLDVPSTKNIRTTDQELQKPRKKSTSVTATKKKQPAKKLVFEMVTEDDHWADE